MRWYYIAILFGIVAPWIVSPKSLLLAFRERGFGIGLAYWSGFLWFTIPLGFLTVWAGYLLGHG